LRRALSLVIYCGSAERHNIFIQSLSCDAIIFNLVKEFPSSFALSA